MLDLFKSKKKTSRVRVLVVDDEADIVSTIEYRLKFNEIDVITAANGKEGLEKAANEKPDLILLDINMPVMDGHEMLERMKHSSDLKDIPVIMLTAFSDAKDVAKAADLGVADYITKPFDFTDLMGKISKALGDKVRV